MREGEALSGVALRRILALLLISAASADEVIHPREEKMIRLGVGSEVYLAALREYQQADADHREALQAEIKSALAAPKAREKALKLLKRLFFADGRYGTEEAQWMETVWAQIRD